MCGRRTWKQRNWRPPGNSCKHRKDAPAEYLFQTWCFGSHSCRNAGPAPWNNSSRFIGGCIRCLLIKPGSIWPPFNVTSAFRTLNPKPDTYSNRDSCSSVAILLLFKAVGWAKMAPAPMSKQPTRRISRGPQPRRDFEFLAQFAESRFVLWEPPDAATSLRQNFELLNFSRSGRQDESENFRQFRVTTASGHHQTALYSLEDGALFARGGGRDSTKAKISATSWSETTFRVYGGIWPDGWRI